MGARTGPGVPGGTSWWCQKPASDEPLARACRSPRCLDLEGHATGAVGGPVRKSGRGPGCEPVTGLSRIDPRLKGRSMMQSGRVVKHGLDWRGLAKGFASEGSLRLRSVMVNRLHMCFLRPNTPGGQEKSFMSTHFSLEGSGAGIDRFSPAVARWHP